MHAFKKTKKQKHVNNKEMYCDKYNSFSKKENFIILIHKELSKNKVRKIIIDININFLEAEMFNLSSTKPKPKIKNEVIKNIIKFSLFLNIISLKNKI